MHKRLFITLVILGMACATYAIGKEQAKEESVVIGTGTVTTAYSPATDLQAIDINTLETAKKTIDASEYAFTDEPIAQEILKKANEGVHVRIYRDLRQYDGEVTRNNALISEYKDNKNVEIRVKHSSVLAHLKAYVVDDTVLREGSANWSESGEQKQDNSLILIYDKICISNFEQNFQKIWTRSDNTVIQ